MSDFTDQVSRMPREKVEHVLDRVATLWELHDFASIGIVLEDNGLTAIDAANDDVAATEDAEEELGNVNAATVVVPTSQPQAPAELWGIWGPARDGNPGDWLSYVTSGGGARRIVAYDTQATAQDVADNMRLDTRANTGETIAWCAMQIGVDPAKLAAAEADAADHKAAFVDLYNAMDTDTDHLCGILITGLGERNDYYHSRQSAESLLDITFSRLHEAEAKVSRLSGVIIEGAARKVYKDKLWLDIAGIAHGTKEEATASSRYAAGIDTDPSAAFVAAMPPVRFVIDKNVSETSPCIRGTWITVAQIVSFIVAGDTWGAILHKHPELNEGDIRAALKFATTQEGDKTAGLVP